MKQILGLVIIILFLFVLVGCTIAPGSGVSSESPVALLTDQQILEQHPDGLDEALIELEELG